MQSIRFPAFLHPFIFILACQPLQYSPYGTNSAALPHFLNAENLDRLLARGCGTCDTFSFAVLADTHRSYDAFNGIVKHMNGDSTLLFLAIPGDITKFGLMQEFAWTTKILLKSKAPFFVTIGNHDALSNGEEIFNKLFGNPDFSFSLGSNRFIFLNDNVWDFDGNVPDLIWLEKELAAVSGQNIFVIAHIPPFGDQFEPMLERTYRLMMAEYGVSLSIHGHNHNYSYADRYADGVKYLVADDAEDWNYVKIDVKGKNVGVTRIQVSKP